MVMQIMLDPIMNQKNSGLLGERFELDVKIESI